MQTSRLFWRWFWTYFGLVLLGLLTMAALADRWQTAELRQAVEAQLQTTASALTLAWGDQPLQATEIEKLNAIARQLHEQTGIRVSFFDRQATLLADSDASLALPPPTASQAALPEAQATGTGRLLRNVPGQGPTLFLAHRLGTADQPLGYLRLSLPLSQSPARVARHRGGLWAVATLLILAGARAAWTLARRVVVPVAQLTAGLNAVAAGHLQPRLDLASDDELGQLGTAFNRMNSELAQRIAELRKSGERLATVLGSMVEAVIAVDARLQVLFANHAARELLDIHPHDAIGRPLWAVVRSRQVQQSAEEAFVQPEPATAEFEMIGKTRRVLALHATRLPGTPCPGVVVVLHDVTELRRLENLRQEFVANVSHELKTPLTAIKAYCETLLAGAISDPDNNVTFLRRIEDQAERLHELILDLLSLARIEADQQRFEITAVDLNRLVDSCVGQYQAAAESRQVLLEIVAPPQPVVVSADEEGVRQILDNLMDNALKYTPAGGRVILRWEAVDGQARLDVEDTGIGIPLEEQSRIFERFYRVDKARSRELGGTGLGLSIVKHLTQALGGSVTVRSEVARGSLFRVLLPLA